MIGSPSGSTAPIVPVIGPSSWPVSCTGLTVGAWLKNVRRISRPIPSTKLWIGPNSAVIGSVAAAVAAAPVMLSAATGFATTRRGISMAVCTAEEVVAVGWPLSAAGVEADGAAGCGATSAGETLLGAANVAVAALRLPRRAAVGLLAVRAAEGVLEDWARVGSVCDSAVAVAVARRCRVAVVFGPVCADVWLWVSETAGDPTSVPSAAATPTTGPARASPSANAAAPTRAPLVATHISKLQRSVTAFPERYIVKARDAKTRVATVTEMRP